MGQAGISGGLRQGDSRLLAPGTWATLLLERHVAEESRPRHPGSGAAFWAPALSCCSLAPLHLGHPGPSLPVPGPCHPCGRCRAEEGSPARQARCSAPPSVRVVPPMRRTGSELLATRYPQGGLPRSRPRASPDAAGRPPRGAGQGAGPRGWEPLSWLRAGYKATLTSWPLLSRPQRPFPMVTGLASTAGTGEECQECTCADCHPQGLWGRGGQRQAHLLDGGARGTVSPRPGALCPFPRAARGQGRRLAFQQPIPGRYRRPADAPQTPGSAGELYSSQGDHSEQTHTQKVDLENKKNKNKKLAKWSSYIKRLY